VLLCGDCWYCVVVLFITLEGEVTHLPPLYLMILIFHCCWIVYYCDGVVVLYCKTIEKCDGRKMSSVWRKINIFKRLALEDMPPLLNGARRRHCTLHHFNAPSPPPSPYAVHFLFSARATPERLLLLKTTDMCDLRAATCAGRNYGVRPWIISLGMWTDVVRIPAQYPPFRGLPSHRAVSNRDTTACSGSISRALLVRLLGARAWCCLMRLTPIRSTIQCADDQRRRGLCVLDRR